MKVLNKISVLFFCMRYEISVSETVMEKIRSEFDVDAVRIVKTGGLLVRYVLMVFGGIWLLQVLAGLVYVWSSAQM